MPGTAQTFQTETSKKAITLESWEGYLLPEVGRLKTRGSSFGDAQSILKMFVECVEETIREAPQEEEDGDEANGVERFFERELCGSRAFLV